MTNDFALVDTNILVYSCNLLSPDFEAAKEFLEESVPEGNLVTSAQNLVEFYSVITDPKTVGHLNDAGLAWIQVQKWADLFSKILVPQTQTIQTISVLLKKYPVKGAEIHDVHLAATMIDNGVKTIYTADERVFRQWGLKVINPLK